MWPLSADRLSQALAHQIGKAPNRSVQRAVIVDHIIGVERRCRAGAFKTALDFCRGFAAARGEPGGNRVRRRRDSDDHGRRKAAPSLVDHRAGYVGNHAASVFECVGEAQRQSVLDAIRGQCSMNRPALRQSANSAEESAR